MGSVPQPAGGASRAVVVQVELNGVPVPLLFDARALRTIADSIARVGVASAPSTPFMTIPEAADYLRCSRQRIDDLLSQRRLTRFKDGARTLVSRVELDAHVHRRAGQWSD